MQAQPYGLRFRATRNPSPLSPGIRGTLPPRVLQLAGLLLAAIAAGCSRPAPQAGQAAPPPTSQPAPAAEPVGLQTFLEAAAGGDAATLNRALTAGRDPDVAAEDGRTALMLTCFDGNTRCAELLVAHGAHVNLKDEGGRTALMYAATSEHPDTVRFLLEHGADINLADGGEKFTALMYAAAEGLTENVRILLQHGADPRIKDVDGDTARMFATQKGHGDTAALLEEAEKAIK
jgi:uncharacterized protein